MENTAFIALLAGALSGVLGSIGTLAAYAHGYIRFEAVEVRRRKIDVAYGVLSYRYALVATVADSESHHGFNRYFNQIPLVFGDDDSVIRAYDSFLSAKTDDNLKILLVEISKKSGIRRQVLDSRLMKTMTVSKKPTQLDQGED